MNIPLTAFTIATIDLTTPITDSVRVAVGGGQTATLDRGPDCRHCGIHAVHTRGGWVAGDARDATKHRCKQMAEAELMSFRASLAELVILKQLGTNNFGGDEAYDRAWATAQELSKDALEAARIAKGR